MTKKREAERIDRENQKIMHRIINVKPHVIKASKMKRDFEQGHMAKRRMIMDKN